MKLFLSIISLLFSITLFSQINVDVLIVGGGGGGEASITGTGSGGGGGQVIKLTNLSITNGTFPVVIGSGGNGGSTGTQVQGSIVPPNTIAYTNPYSGSPGGTSSFYSYSAIGGGGAILNSSPSPSNYDEDLGGNSYGATTSIVYTGGLRTYENNGFGWHYGGGGGAGSGGNGNNASLGENSVITAGNGGPGVSCDYSGSNVYYGGGGGGGATFSDDYPDKAIQSSGGAGGGGRGAYGSSNNASAIGTNGTANTGGGGGGASIGSLINGYDGGSGIVIIRYLDPGPQARATGGVITVSGGYVIHTFTSSGDFITSSPSISISNPTASLTSCLGSASSSPTTFIVTGSDLTTNVIVTAPSNFEIATSSNGSYSSSLTLTNASTVNQTLYVRLNASATVGAKLGTITATSIGATGVTTTVSGTVNALPTVTVTKAETSGTTINDAVICSGASITLSGGGALSYVWNNSITNGSSFTPSTTTAYTVTGTDVNGCVNTAIETVTVNPLPNIGISGTTTNPELVTLTASGGSTYVWSDGSSTNTANNTFDASGSYVLSVTDANGCVSSTQRSITVQQWGLSRTGEKILDSANQINSNGQRGSLNPITATGKISIYKIYNNGLVLNLDASNATSYSGNGNIWYDLSGNNINATFGTSSPTYSNLNGGIFNFNGTQDMTLALDDLPYGNSRFTLNAWAKATVTNLECNLIIAYGNATYGEARFLGSCDGKFQFGGFGGGVHDVQSSIDFPLNTWVNMTGTYDGSTAILYINGVEISRKSINNWNTVKQSGYIGEQVGGLTQRWNGSISNVQLYNRVLLPSEVLANYNALKSRFGL